MSLLTLILTKTTEEQLSEIIPVLAAIAIMLTIFTAIMGYKRRGKETEEEEDTEKEPVDQVEEVRAMQENKLPGMDAKSLKERLEDEN